MATDPTNLDEAGAAVPEVHALLHGMIEELCSIPGVDVLTREVPQRDSSTCEKVLTSARRLSGLSLPDAWLPICADAPLRVAWAGPGIDGGCHLWPIDDQWEMYQPPLVDGGGLLWLDPNRMPEPGCGSTPYDTYGASRVVMRASPHAEGPELYFSDHSHRAWKLDLDLPGYVRALRQARGIRDWQRLYCPLGRHDDTLPLLAQALENLVEHFGAEAVDELPVTPNSAANLARLRALQTLEGWPEHAHHLVRQPILLVSLDSELVRSERRWEALNAATDGAFFVRSPLVSSFLRFAELPERGVILQSQQEAIVDAVLQWMPDEIFSTYQARTRFFTPIDGALSFSVGFHDASVNQLRDAFEAWGFTVYTEAHLSSAEWIQPPRPPWQT